MATLETLAREQKKAITEEMDKIVELQKKKALLMGRLEDASSKLQSASASDDEGIMRLFELVSY